MGGYGWVYSVLPAGLMLVVVRVVFRVVVVVVIVVIDWVDALS